MNSDPMHAMCMLVLLAKDTRLAHAAHAKWHLRGDVTRKRTRSWHCRLASHRRGKEDTMAMINNTREACSSYTCTLQPPPLLQTPHCTHCTHCTSCNRQRKTLCVSRMNGASQNIPIHKRRVSMQCRYITATIDHDCNTEDTLHAGASWAQLMDERGRQMPETPSAHSCKI